MELIVPTTFEAGLASALVGSPARYLYGSLPDGASARPGRWLPPTDPEGAARHIALARSVGIGFLYTFNAACGGNAEFTGEGQRWLAERLGWLVEAGAEGIVTANPYLMALVKRRFPELRVHVSSLAGADTPDKALFYERLGASAIYLPEYVNRDLRLLRALRRQVDVDLVIMVNLGCLLHCPIRHYHANYVSHAAEGLARGCYLDYSLATCVAVKTARPAELLKAPWVRPEDLGRYEEIGVGRFKIAGREQGAAWILRAVAAYTRRTYPGDLNDLIPGLDGVEPFGPFPVRIHNGRLDGFLDSFAKKDCRLGCEGCAHCDEWAGKAVSVARDREEYVGKIERLLGRFTSGAFRASPTRA